MRVEEQALVEKYISMERRVRWKSHARCGAGENLEIVSNSYLSPYYAAEGEGTVKNSILIAPYTIKLADGTMAKRHPFSIFMMSANPDAKGSRPINEAYSASRS